MPKRKTKIIKRDDRKHVYTRGSVEFKRSFDSLMTIWIRENRERAREILDRMDELDRKRAGQKALDQSSRVEVTS